MGDEWTWQDLNLVESQMLSFQKKMTPLEPSQMSLLREDTERCYRWVLCYMVRYISLYRWVPIYVVKCVGRYRWVLVYEK